MKPIIGINLDIEDGNRPRAGVQMNYLHAIQDAGGIPLLLPPLPNDDLETLLRSVQAILFIGGPDYAPSLYDEQPHDKLQLIDQRRQEFDLRLMKRALNDTEFPVLGICGGLQLLNISLGGSLIQDIPSELPASKVVHTKANGCGEGVHTHQVAIQPDSRLGKIYQQETLAVHTSHHQAVRKLGQGLKAVAHAEDGVIEAIESPERTFTIGVQWHPERDYGGNESLFQEFIKHAGKRGQR